MTAAKFLPKPVSDLDVMMGATSVAEILPAAAEFQPFYKSKFADVVTGLFFNGGSTREWEAKDGVDRDQALRHFKAVLKSFTPSHEVKIAACAFMLSEWFVEESLWTTFTGVTK